MYTEYPRPQMERTQWQDLCGPWDYAITDSDQPPSSWDGKILVPFSPEAPLSGVERTLVGSKYNARVDEMKAAAYWLMADSGMEYGRFADTRLRMVPREIFEERKNGLPVAWRMRAEHYYSEAERVEKGVAAWRRGDLKTFGECIFESGYSSIYSYETGSDELRALYEAMTHTDGIYGGRFSGAGFKGCCMALIDPAKRDEIAAAIEREYLARFPALRGKYMAYFCRTADGCGTGVE